MKTSRIIDSQIIAISKQWRRSWPISAPWGNKAPPVTSAEVNRYRNVPID